MWHIVFNFGCVNNLWELLKWFTRILILILENEKERSGRKCNQNGKPKQDEYLLSDVLYVTEYISILISIVNIWSLFPEIIYLFILWIFIPDVANQSVRFDDKGDGLARYTIYNYQKDENSNTSDYKVCISDVHKRTMRNVKSFM